MTQAAEQGGGGEALRAVAASLGRAGRWVGRGVAQAYQAVDPDVRRHVFEAPMLSFSLLGGRVNRVAAKPADGHLPLVFVHGLCGRGAGFLPMMWALARQQGRTRAYRFEYPGERGWAAVDTHAAALAGFVGEVLAVTGCPAVEMVAHSFGGIVARLALTDHGLAAGQVRTLITLGTPHGGTYTARFASTGATRMLRPSSPLIERLARAGWPRGVRGVAVYSRSDVLVLPPEAATATGAASIEAPELTHYGFLLSPRSWGLVAAHLTH